MPAVRTVTKKTTKTAVAAPKTAKKITLADLTAIVADIGKAHRENEKGFKELRKAHEETEKGFRELRKVHEETEKIVAETSKGIGRTEKTVAETLKGIDSLNKARRETEKDFKELRKAHEETEKGFKELRKAHEETEKGLRELQKVHEETAKIVAETSKSVEMTEKVVAETSRNMGGLNNTVGSLTEKIMTPRLPQAFQALGFDFDRVSNSRWYSKDRRSSAEIDGLLENGTQAMLVEVKTTLKRGDIDYHLKRMEKVRYFANERNDHRDFLGAMAAMSIRDEDKAYLLEQGLFFIAPAGEDLIITEPIDKPRIW